jgi:hypothetical protein
MHNILEQAIGSAPVSTVDVDAVVAKARRHNARRRLAIGSAAGGTALVAAGVVATLTMTYPRRRSRADHPRPAR